MQRPTVTERYFSNAMITCEIKLFQNNFRCLLQLTIIFQHVQCRLNNFEIISVFYFTCNWRLLADQAGHTTPYGPLRPNVTSSIKPEVHNIARRRRGRTEPRPQRICIQNFVKIGPVVPEICSRQTDRHTQRQTDRHTDRQFGHNTPHPYRGGVMKHWNYFKIILFHMWPWHYPFNTKGVNDVICYYSLWSVLPTPCCRATSRKQHRRNSYLLKYL